MQTTLTYVREVTSTPYELIPLLQMRGKWCPPLTNSYHLSWCEGSDSCPLWTHTTLINARVATPTPNEDLPPPLMQAKWCSPLMKSYHPSTYPLWRPTTPPQARAHNPHLLQPLQCATTPQEVLPPYCYGGPKNCHLPRCHVIRTSPGNIIKIASNSGQTKQFFGQKAETENDPPQKAEILAKTKFRP